MTGARVFRPRRRTLVWDTVGSLWIVVSSAVAALHPEAHPWLRTLAVPFGAFIAAFFAMTVTRRVTVTAGYVEVRRLGMRRRFDPSRAEVTFFRVVGGHGMTVTGDGRPWTFALTSFSFDEVVALRRAMSSGSPPRHTTRDDNTRRNP